MTTISGVSAFISKVKTRACCDNYYFNLANIILNITLICSLSTPFINSLTNITIKDVNAKPTYLKNPSNTIWSEQDSGSTVLKSTSQNVKGDNINRVITLDSFQSDIDRLSSINRLTIDSLYSVKLSWDPAGLKEGKDTIFMIDFLDARTKSEIKQIDYSFRVMFSSANLTVKDVKHQKAPTGSGIQIVKLPMSGQLNIRVNFTFPQQQLNKIDTNNR